MKTWLEELDRPVLEIRPVGASEQLEMGLAAAEEFSEEEGLAAGVLVNVLAGSPEWRSADELAGVLGLPQTETGRRRVRRLAQAGCPEVISGQGGYRHVRHATAAEVHHFVRGMEAQARKMTARAEAVRRRAHGLVG